MEIEEFFKNYKNFAWHKDTKAMIDLYDEQAVIFDMWDSISSYFKRRCCFKENEE